MHRTISYNRHTNHSPVNPLRSHITLQSRRTGLLLSSLNERNSTRTSAENRTKRPERSTATTEYDYDNPRFRHSIPPIPLPHLNQNQTGVPAIRGSDSGGSYVVNIRYATETMLVSKDERTIHSPFLPPTKTQQSLKQDNSNIYIKSTIYAHITCSLYNMYTVTYLHTYVHLSMHTYIQNIGAQIIIIIYKYSKDPRKIVLVIIKAPIS